jgi:hypothetical protein
MEPFNGMEQLFVLVEDLKDMRNDVLSGGSVKIIEKSKESNLLANIISLLVGTCRSSG